MSILIKDMEMPKRCLECPFYDNYNYYCTLYSFGIPVRYNLDGNTRPEWCELENLPSAQPEPLTDKEQRIFLAAMEREEKVCEEVDRNYVREP